MSMNASDRTVLCEVADVALRKLDVSVALEFVSNSGFGGISMFLGRVRDLNLGRSVFGVSYDMFDPLALAVFGDAATDAKFVCGPHLKIYVAHAKGRLAVGDLAVVIAVGAPHRDEAFRACRAVIEAVKHRAPIWKQEHYADGDSVWSEGCSLCGAEQGDGRTHAHDALRR
jgi:molybdopterin synthase catalytic subunit